MNPRGLKQFICPLCEGTGVDRDMPLDFRDPDPCHGCHGGGYVTFGTVEAIEERAELFAAVPEYTARIRYPHAE